MIAILYERRYWNIQYGKVLAVFSMHEDDEIFKLSPSIHSNYWVWLDEKPQRLCVDVMAAFDRAGSDICEHSVPGV